MGDQFKEQRDLFVTLALAIRVHKGKEKKIKKAAETIRRRLLYVQSIQYCDQFILFPEKAEFLLNAVTENIFGLQFLKIKRFGNGHSSRVLS